MANSLAWVSFSQVRFDETTVSTLPERFSANSSQTRIDRLRQSSPRRKVGGERFQRVEPELVHPLTLASQPFLVPTGEEITSPDDPVHLVRFRVDGAPHDRTSQLDELVNIDLHAGSQAKVCG